MTSWYALRVHPRRETTVRDNLEVLGHDVLLPLEYKRKRLSGKSKSYRVVTYPMFLGYVFTGLSDDPVERMYQLAQIRLLPFAIDVLRFQAENRYGVRPPAPLSDDGVRWLRDINGRDIAYHATRNPHRALRKDELAEIAVGPFAGQVVRIEAIQGHKAKIFLNLFGARKLVEINADNLVAA